MAMALPGEGNNTEKEINDYISSLNTTIAIKVDGFSTSVTADSETSAMAFLIAGKALIEAASEIMGEGSNVKQILDALVSTPVGEEKGEEDGEDRHEWTE